MSLTDTDTRSFAGPSTHVELLRLAWGCIDGALTLPGFDESKTSSGHMVSAPLAADFMTSDNPLSHPLGLLGSGSTIPGIPLLPAPLLE